MLVARALTALAVAAALASGCAAGAVPSREEPETPIVPPGAVLVRGAGGTFPFPLYEEWFRQYQQQHPATVVAYDPVGSGEGIQRFIGRTVDFGASDAAMRDDEIARVPGGALLLPLTAGSVALAFELPDVAGDLKLSREAYTGIFLDTIRTWNDPRIARTNPGVKLPDLTIATVVRQDSSGTTFAFTKHLDAISDAWRSRFGPATLVNWPGNSMRAVGNEGVAARIKESVGSIGYVSYEFARKTGLRVALLENRAGNMVAPTASASAAALAEAELPDNLRAYVPDPSGPEAYPIVTLTWILVYRNYADQKKHRALQDLFRWCLTDGQQSAAGMGYVPLPPAMARRSIAALDEIRNAP